jgi:DNA polymerase III epsilon subunit-like protein
MALILDVETTGFPDRTGMAYGQNPCYVHLEKYETSRLVQFSMLLCNETWDEIEMKDYVVKSDGFSIGNACFHGITNEISQTQGVPFSEIVEALSRSLKQVSHVVAHNANFDLSILKSELFRGGYHSVLSELVKKKTICTMAHTKSIVKAKMTNGGRIKDPRLDELYAFAMKKLMENAHNSKYDVIHLHSAIKTLVDSKQLCLPAPAPLVLVSTPTASEQVPTETTPGDVSEVTNDLSKATLKQLRQLGKDHGVKGYNKINKPALYEKLNSLALGLSWNELEG